MFAGGFVCVCLVKYSLSEEPTTPFFFTMLQISQGAFYARGCVAAACGGKSRARVRIERRGRGRGGVPFAGPWRRALRSEAAEVADEGVQSGNSYVFVPPAVGQGNDFFLRVSAKIFFGCFFRA